MDLFKKQGQNEVNTFARGSSEVIFNLSNQSPLLSFPLAISVE